MTRKEWNCEYAALLTNVGFASNIADEIVADADMFYESDMTPQEAFEEEISNWG